MLRTTLSLCVVLAIAGCAQSVKLISPQSGSTVSNPVPIEVEFHQRANVSTFRATVESAGNPPLDITGNFTPAPLAGQRSTAQVTMPPHACPVNQAGCTQERTIRLESNFSPRQAFDVIGHGEKVQLTGTTTQPPPPGPSITLDVTTPAATVVWGGTANYMAEVEWRGPFNGPVTLTAQNLPAGASSTPVTVSRPANGQGSFPLTVTTAAGGTALGASPNNMRIRATGSSVSARTHNISLRVLPTAGAFQSLSWRTASSTCSSGGVTINANRPNTLSFQGPGFNVNAGQILWYAFTPNCRGAVVIGPSAGANQGNPAILFNFRFPSTIADAPGSSRTLGLHAWDQTHFLVSGDGSLVIATSVNAQGRPATLWNMLSLNQIGSPQSYSVNSTLRASVVGAQVQANPTNSNSWTWNLP